MSGLLNSEVAGPVPEDLRWWLAEDDDAMAGAAFAAAKNILTNNIERDEIIWRNMRMYSGQSRESFWGENGDYPLSVNRMLNNQHANRNVIASVADTLVATLTATPIKTTVLASGGDYARTRKKSKAAEKFCSGVKYNNKFEEIGAKACLSGFICDLGICKVMEDDEEPGTIKLEPVFPAEIIVDEVDGIHQQPRQIMQRKLVSREVLVDLYPEFAEEIRGLNPVGTGLSTMSLADKIEVLECWHLGTGKKRQGGLHIIAIDTKVLFKEKWLLHKFPFAWFRASLNLIGFWSNGIATDLCGIQYAINELTLRKQRALKVASNVMVLVPTGSQVNKNHILNGIGLMLEYSGDQPPQWYTPSPVSKDIPPEIADLISWAYQRWGVSQLSSQSQKPEGLDSAVALRTYANIESVRQSVPGKAYQQFCLDVDELVLLTARMIDQRRENEHKAALKKGKKHTKKPLKVRVPDAKRVVEISWDDADPGDGFIVKRYATNLFADSPADRLAQTGDLVDKGAIDMDTFLEINDFPDLEKFNKIRNAPRENIEKQLDDILLDGKYRSPEPFQNLALGVQMFQSALLSAEDDGVPDDRLAMLQRWIGEAVKLMSPPPPPPAAPPMGAGPIAPMAAPVLAPPPGTIPPPGAVPIKPMPVPMAPPPAPMPGQ